MITVAGKNVVVTGTVPGESRVTAQQRLRAAGAYVHDAVNGTTDILVCGAKVGQSKMNAAAKKGITILPWDQIAWDGQGDGEVSEIPTAPTAVVARQIGPMLAEKGDLPVGAEWSYEVKWDGVRCVATVKDGTVAMQSRSGKTDYAAQYPHIAAELATLPDCVLDGELVVLTHAGGSFRDIAQGNGRGSFVVFDCIERNGTDLRGDPLHIRRIAVTSVLEEQPLVFVAQSPWWEDGQALLDYCARNGMEGVVAKQLGSRYLDGARSALWTKVKCRLEQEFIVVGYTSGEGRRADTFGALLLGYIGDDGEMVYAGKVGTGWDDQEHDRLFGILTLNPLIPGVSPLPPFVSKDVAGDTAWVDDALIVQVAFQRWTEDGILWHPSYQGQRSDKKPGEVRRES